jgi:hypothetical protein
LPVGGIVGHATLVVCGTVSAFGKAHGLLVTPRALAEAAIVCVQAVLPIVGVVSDARLIVRDTGSASKLLAHALHGRPGAASVARLNVTGTILDLSVRSSIANAALVLVGARVA